MIPCSEPHAVALLVIMPGGSEPHVAANALAAQRVAGHVTSPMSATASSGPVQLLLAMPPAPAPALPAPAFPFAPALPLAPPVEPVASLAALPPQLRATATHAKLAARVQSRSTIALGNARTAYSARAQNSAGNCGFNTLARLCCPPEPRFGHRAWRRLLNTKAQRAGSEEPARRAAADLQSRLRRARTPRPPRPRSRTLRVCRSTPSRVHRAA